MAVFDKNGLFQRLVALIRSNGVNGLTKAVDVREMFTDLIDSVWSKFGEATSPATLALDWKADVTYDTVNKPYAVYQLRIYKTKIDANLGNTPPVVPDVDGNYEDANWVEVSAAPTSGISSWKAGVFMPGLVIVEHNNQLLKLLVPDADRPFESTDINAELTDDPATTKWKVLTGASEGGGATGLHYKLHFYNFDSYTESFFEARTINSIRKDTNISRLFYTKNALAEQEVAFPFAGTISAADGDKITWRIVFAPDKFDGTIQIKGE